MERENRSSQVPRGLKTETSARMLSRLLAKFSSKKWSHEDLLCSFWERGEINSDKKYLIFVYNAHPHFCVHYTQDYYTHGMSSLNWCILIFPSKIWAKNVSIIHGKIRYLFPFVCACIYVSIFHFFKIFIVIQLTVICPFSPSLHPTPVYFIFNK